MAGVASPKYVLSGNVEHGRIWGSCANHAQLSLEPCANNQFWPPLSRLLPYFRSSLPEYRARLHSIGCRADSPNKARLPPLLSVLKSLLGTEQSRDDHGREIPDLPTPRAVQQACATNSTEKNPVSLRLRALGK